jgi:hypothetical protein
LYHIPSTVGILKLLKLKIGLTTRALPLLIRVLFLAEELLVPRRPLRRQEQIANSKLKCARRKPSRSSPERATHYLVILVGFRSPFCSIAQPPALDFGGIVGKAITAC